MVLRTRCVRMHELGRPHEAVDFYRAAKAAWIDIIKTTQGVYCHDITFGLLNLTPMVTVNLGTDTRTLRQVSLSNLEPDYSLPREDYPRKDQLLLL